MAKPKILENISTIQNSGFTNRAKQAEVTSYKELGNGRWFGELTDAPESGVFFYNVFKGDNDNYKYVEAVSWINDKIFISKCINGEWSAWEDRKSVLESKINVLSGGDVKNANEISVTDANNLPIGWYTGDLTNAPYKDWATFHTFNKLGNSYKTQVAYGVNNPFMAYRNFINGKYEDWKQIATTNKTEILLAPAENITIEENKSFSQNGINYIIATFVKTDGSLFMKDTYEPLLHKLETAQKQCGSATGSLEGLFNTYGSAHVGNSILYAMVNKDCQKIYIKLIY